MNSNLAKVGKPTRWPPGQSGNPAGKPPGTRTAFSQGFIRDFALVWAEEGLEAVRKERRKASIDTRLENRFLNEGLQLLRECVRRHRPTGCRAEDDRV